MKRIVFLALAILAVNTLAGCDKDECPVCMECECACPPACQQCAPAECSCPQ